MKILVINAGSSSIKYQLIDISTNKRILKGLCERIGLDGSKITQKNENGKVYKIEKPMSSHKEAMQYVLNAMMDKDYGAINNVLDIYAVGHRVIYPGENHSAVNIINEDFINDYNKYSELFPLHVPGTILCIRACQAIMPNTRMVSVSDTIFHEELPAHAFLFGIPYSLYKQYGIRKYGYHGLSYKYVNEKALDYLNNPNAKLIICHLGSGASIAAAQNSKSIDVTTGFSSLPGLVMGTRCGDLDVSAADYIRKKLNYTTDQLIEFLHKKCGLLGISELSSDCRDLTEAAQNGNKQAQLALDVFSYKVKKTVGSFLAVLNGADAIVFTGGIGEHSPEIREASMSNMEYCGIILDKNKNNNCKNDVCEINADNSKIKILVIPTNEELEIAKETYKILN